MTRSMHNSSAFVKQDFLKKWLNCLKIYNKFKTKMTILERKRAIKLSADMAIASTRNPTTHWSRATMAGATMEKHILTSEEISKNVSTNNYKCKNNKNFQRTRGILTCACKKVKSRRRVVPRRMKSVLRARKVVKNRTLVLKGLVPGGHDMDEVCLIKETLDYVASLRVQVDVMRHIAAAVVATKGLDTQEIID
ncbi:transcription factor IBH1-like 1 [Andrographis paniculata]|uniref:transcription factor IBH1-like 1 n=1 Tax=Andrographis paniculata TaxID=175694 RepID=UPI0021E956C5|nr:transcription factor IBH1-like 1 [Andrographis paniculata]